MRMSQAGRRAGVRFKGGGSSGEASWINTRMDDPTDDPSGDLQITSHQFYDG